MHTDGSIVQVDYYHLWCLASGLIPQNDDAMTGIRRRVFEAVRELNFKRLGETWCDPKSDSRASVLRTISYNKGVWVDVPSIHEAINEDGGEIISFSELNNALSELCKSDLIKSQKVQTREGYAVNTLVATSGIELPHPSGIDPNNEIQVLDPVTGEMVTI